MDDEKMWQAVVHNDATCDGKFFYGVKTTGIFCRPSCRSKVPNRENVTFFKTADEAMVAGYRPCKRCRPDLLTYDPSNDLAVRAKSLIEEDYADKTALSRELSSLGVSQKHLARVFAAQYDLTLNEYLRQTRIRRAKDLLQDGVSVLDTASGTGFSGLSAFYTAFKHECGMTPARYRQLFAKDISRAYYASPIGTIRIIASKDAILCVERIEEKQQDAILPDASGDLARACRTELMEYFDLSRKTFDLPLSPEGTDFQKTVWKCLVTIPYGETRTYAEVAAMTGNEKASRAVGMANHCNPILIIVPCHRVIGTDGSLTGYAAGVENKKFLLALERGNL